MFRVLCVLISALIAVLMPLGGSATAYKSPEAMGVVINEVCSANTRSIKDRDTESPDWIELYNTTGDTVSLYGCSLTDDVDNPGKFVFQDVRIEPYGYIIVFASKKKNMLPELHAGFRLSSEGGETVYLIGADESVISEVTLPALDNDTAYGRRIDGYDMWERLTPTPGRPNNTATVVTLRAEVAPPMFSHESGFYDEALMLTLTADEGSRIYYTLDGSDPSVHSRRYISPIPVTELIDKPAPLAMRKDISVLYNYTPPQEIVDQCSVVRAIAVDKDGKQSVIQTKSYFVGLDRERYEGIALVSLVTDPKNLVDPEIGIYVTGKTYEDYKKSEEAESSPVAGWEQPANYRMKGREWEREASFTYFNEHGEYVCSQQVGVRVHGQASRAGLQKSLRLYARRAYDGNEAFIYNPFDSVTQTRTMLLRSGGSDSSYTKLRDVFFQSLAQGRQVDIQQFEPCIVFLDGEYWGVYNIQQRSDKDYIQGKYGIDDDNVISANSWSIKDGIAQDSELYQELMSALSQDLSRENNYYKVCELMDIQSLIDHFCTEIFAANWDWPINNIEMWRSRTVSDRAYEDGVWRFKLIDMDYTGAYNSNASYEYNTFTKAMTSDFIKPLLNNSTFRQRFVLTMMDLLNENFSVKNTTELFDKTASRYAPYIGAYFQRFISMRERDVFGENIAAIRTFLQKRPDVIKQQLRSTFALEGYPAPITLKASDTQGGEVLINTIKPDITKGEWKGEYFTDYPVSLTAKPNEGYVFSHWTVENGNLLGDASDTTAELRVSELGTVVTAVFTPGGENREVLAEYRYVNGDMTRALTGNSREGYMATGGAYRNLSRVRASVNNSSGRKLAWSKDEYSGAVVPVMSADNKNTWALGSYIDFEMSTQGYENITISARLGASERGPRRLALQYSLSGEGYIDIPGTDVILSRQNTMYAAYSNFRLPEAINDLNTVHIRICVSADKSIRGLSPLFGTDQGELAFDDVVFTGAQIPRTYDEYDRLADAISDMEGIPAKEREELDALIMKHSGESGRSQARISSASQELKEAFGALLVSRTDLDTFTRFVPAQALENAVIVNMYEGARDVLDKIVVGVPFAGTAYIYRYDEAKDTLTECGSEKVYAYNVAMPNIENGRYLLTGEPIERLQFSCDISKEPLSEEFVENELLGGHPGTHAWITLEPLVAKPMGTYTVDISGFGFRNGAYVYSVDGGAYSEIASAAEGSELRFNTTGGRYLLLPESVSDIQSEQLLYKSLREQTLEDEKKEAKSGTFGGKWLYIAAGAAVLALAGATYLIIRTRRRKK